MEFEDEIVRLIPWLRTMAHYFTKDRMELDDLVSETVCKALCSKDKYNRDMPIKPWLDAIMSNTYISMYRHAKIIQIVRNDLEHYPIDYGRRTASTVYMREINDAIERCRKKARQSTEALLMFIEGYSYVEISERYGISMGTVKSRIAHGRVLLRKELDYKVK